jgi:hypothetical protein
VPYDACYARGRFGEYPKVKLEGLALRHEKGAEAYATLLTHKTVLREELSIDAY